jgi:hypothetical protein
MSSRPPLASRRAGAAASLMSAGYGLNGSFICQFINFEDTPAAVTCHVARFRDPTSTDNFRQAHGVARPTPREILRLVLFVTRAVVVLERAATNSGLRRRQRSGCEETTLSRVDRVTSPHVRR